MASFAYETNLSAFWWYWFFFAWKMIKPVKEALISDQMRYKLWAYTKYWKQNTVTTRCINLAWLKQSRNTTSRFPHWDDDSLFEVSEKSSTKRYLNIVNANTNGKKSLHDVLWQGKTTLSLSSILISFSEEIKSASNII